MDWSKILKIINLGVADHDFPFAYNMYLCTTKRILIAGPFSLLSDQKLTSDKILKT